jgi:hypothetical protein
MAGRNAKPVIKSACLPSIPKDFAAVVSDCIYILTHEIGPDCTQIGFHVTLPNRRLRTWICVGASQKPYLDLVWRSDQINNHVRAGGREIQGAGALYFIWSERFLKGNCFKSRISLFNVSSEVVPDFQKCLLHGRAQF